MRIERCKSHWLAALLGLGLSLGAMAGPDAWSLADVVRDALLTNPDVAEARNQWQARREEVKQAEGGLLPSVDLNAGIGYEYSNSPSTRNPSAANGSNDLTRKEFGLTIRQMLFDGRGTRSEVARQQARTDSAAARLLSVGESTAMRAVEAYVDLQRYQDLHAIASETLEVHQRIQDQIRLRSEAGVGRRADYDQVQSRVALAEINLLSAAVNLNDAATTFQRVVGELPGAEYAPLGDPPRVPDSLERAVQIAQSGNPVIKIAEADIAAARAQHAAARQFDYPRVDLELGSSLNDDLDGSEGHVEDLTAMLRIRYNLFRGGTDAARKRATAHNINEASDIHDRSLRQAEEAVRLAWAAMQTTAAQLPLIWQQVAAAEATRSAYEKQFNIGQRTLLDLLNSENEVAQARQSMVETRADHQLAQYRLLEAMGVLIESLGIVDVLAGQP